MSAATRVAARRLRLAGRTRKAVLTTHIASAVALLGTTAGLAIMGTRTAGSDDFHQAHAVYDVMSLLTFSLGIPLSFIALASGVLLATTSKWGLFGYWWVTTKLALLVGVIVIGATVTGASIDTMLDVTERQVPESFSGGSDAKAGQPGGAAGQPRERGADRPVEIVRRRHPARLHGPIVACYDFTRSGARRRHFLDWRTLQPWPASATSAASARSPAGTPSQSG